MNFTPVEPQRLAIEYLLQHPRAYLAVGMGIGKTSSVLSAFVKLQESSAVKAMLVIAPLRVAATTWPLEIEQWAQFRHLRVSSLRTPEGREAFLTGTGTIYTINFEGIPTLVKLVSKRKGTVPYQMVVYDEATRTKNPTSKRVAQLRKQVPGVARRVCLSGTPAPNSLMDLFAQYRLLDDGERLGRSFTHFKQTYFHATDYQQFNWVPNDGAEKTIEKKISDITLVLRTSDWLKDVPDAVIEDVEVKLPDPLMKQYREFEKELVLELQNEDQITAANAAVLVMKLLQFTSGSIYGEDKLPRAIHALKIDALKKIVKASKSPVLVAINFKHEQDRLRSEFPQAQFFADAKTSASQVDMLNRWNRREIPILVAHPKSCGHGLNMQIGSNRIVYMTLSYSREAYEQMIARLVRRGQPEAVVVHRLMCPGTVDDAVASVLESKRDTEDRLLAALSLLESVRDKKLKIKLKPTNDDWI